MKTACTLTSLKDLKDVKEAFEQRRSMPPASKAAKESMQHTKTDEDLFREAMADVREIAEFRAIPVKHPAPYQRCPLKKDEDTEILRQIVSGDRKIRLSDTGEYMEWNHPSIRKDVTKMLHGGAFAVQDCIDLHGMTQAEAEEAVTHFLKEAVRRRFFCVKIIHGRGLRSPGGPVLKETLKTLLRTKLRKQVLAYATAKDRDGGLGATYILLR